MEFFVLGPVRADGDRREPVALAGPKQRLVLALLVLRVGSAYSADELIESIWGDKASAGSRSTLQTYISNLRAITGGLVDRGLDGYRLATAESHIDARRFEQAISASRPMLLADPSEASAILRQALTMWKGRPYSGVPSTSLLECEARRLEQLRRQAIEDRIDADLAVGRHRELVPELEILTSEYPWSEHLRGQQMVALYRAGKQVEALRCYEDAKRWLADEVGATPSPTLRQLRTRILLHDATLQSARQLFA